MGGEPRAKWRLGHLPRPLKQEDGPRTPKFNHLNEEMVANCKARTLGIQVFVYPALCSLEGWASSSTNWQRPVLILGHKDDPNLSSPCFIFLTDVSRHVCNRQGIDAQVQVLSAPEALCKRSPTEADFRPWVFHVIGRIPTSQRKFTWEIGAAQACS